jgi:hypothetical protein
MVALCGEVLQWSYSDLLASFPSRSARRLRRSQPWIAAHAS